MKWVDKIKDFIWPPAPPFLPPAHRIIAKVELVSYKDKPLPAEWRPTAMFYEDDEQHWSVRITEIEKDERGRFTGYAQLLCSEADRYLECNKLVKFYEGGRLKADGLIIAVWTSGVFFK